LPAEEYGIRYSIFEVEAYGYEGEIKFNEDKSRILPVLNLKA